jgi:hypothetical protein
LYICLY